MDIIDKEVLMTETSTEASSTSEPDNELKTPYDIIVDSLNRANNAIELLDLLATVNSNEIIGIYSKIRDNILIIKGNLTNHIRLASDNTKNNNSNLLVYEKRRVNYLQEILVKELIITEDLQKTINQHEDTIKKLRARIPSKSKKRSSSSINNSINDELPNPKAESEDNFIGLHILKNFFGQHYYGVVRSFNAPFFKVLYEDGDCEEYCITELKRLLVDVIPEEKRVLCHAALIDYSSENDIILEDCVEVESQKVKSNSHSTTKYSSVGNRISSSSSNSNGIHPTAEVQKPPEKKRRSSSGSNNSRRGHHDRGKSESNSNKRSKSQAHKGSTIDAENRGEVKSKVEATATSEVSIDTASGAGGRENKPAVMQTRGKRPISQTDTNNNNDSSSLLEENRRSNEVIVLTHPEAVRKFNLFLKKGVAGVGVRTTSTSNSGQRESLVAEDPVHNAATTATTSAPPPAASSSFSHSDRQTSQMDVWIPKVINNSNNKNSDNNCNNMDRNTTNNNNNKNNNYHRSLTHQKVSVNESRSNGTMSPASTIIDKANELPSSILIDMNQEIIEKNIDGPDFHDPFGDVIDLTTDLISEDSESPSDSDMPPLVAAFTANAAGSRDREVGKRSDVTDRKIRSDLFNIRNVSEYISIDGKATRSEWTERSSSNRVENSSMLHSSHNNSNSHEGKPPVSKAIRPPPKSNYDSDS